MTDNGNPSSWHQWWNSPLGSAVSLTILLIVGGTLLFSQLTSQGFWEPWDSHRLQRILDEKKASSKQKQNQSDVNRYDNHSELKHRVLSALSLEKKLRAPLDVGTAEWESRFPFALVALLFLLGLFGWVRMDMGNWPAVVATLLVSFTPTFLFGVQSIASDLFYLTLSSSALVCGYLFIHAKNKSYRHLFAFGLAILLVGSYFEYRIFGLLYPVATIVGYGLFERLRDHESFGFINLAVTGLILIGLSVLIFLNLNLGGKPEDIFVRSSETWLFSILPTVLLLTGLWLSRRGQVISRFASGPGLTGLVVFAGAFWLLYPDIPAARGFFEYGVFAPSSELSDEIFHFAFWLRRAGFSLFPWSAFIPLGVGYLVYRRDKRLHAYLLVWSLVSFLVTPLIGYFRPVTFVGVVPIALSVGLAFADEQFWGKLQTRTLIRKAIGVGSIAGILIFFKDLERFPARLLESFLPVVDVLEVPDGFEFGMSLKILKYALAVVSILVFFRPLSWFALRWRFVKKLPGRILAWFKSPSLPSPTKHSTPDGKDPLLALQSRKNQLRNQSSWLSTVLKIESTRSTHILFALFGLISSLVVVFRYSPNLNSYFSQRDVYEAFETNAQKKAKLFTYDLDEYDDSIYLKTLDEIHQISNLVDKFEPKSNPIYAVIPRNELPALNDSVRKRFGYNVPLVFDNDSKLILVTNKKSAGPDKSFIQEAIVKNPDPRFSLLYSKDGQMTRASFENHLDLVGYDLNKEIGKNDTIPTYRWGETFKLTTYFEVKNKLNRDYKIFMHIDHGSNRIHGDHKPVNGAFPTQYWYPGDTIRDRYSIEIPPYSTPGIYTIYFGFYKGDDRLAISPDQAHDGENRLILGHFRVKSSYF